MMRLRWRRGGWRIGVGGGVRHMCISMCHNLYMRVKKSWGSMVSVLLQSLIKPNQVLVVPYYSSMAGVFRYFGY